MEKKNCEITDDQLREQSGLHHKNRLECQRLNDISKARDVDNRGLEIRVQSME